MKNIARELRVTVDEVSRVLSRMKDGDASKKDRAEEWSKKEILGHLIDSAANNHQRFVRAAYCAAREFPAYNQNEWVLIQRYHESDWANLIALWSAYNRHLSHVIERIPEEAWSSPCNIGRGEQVPLELVVKDYLRHLRHHVTDILKEEMDQGVLYGSCLDGRK